MAVSIAYISTNWMTMPISLKYRTTPCKSNLHIPAQLKPASAAGDDVLVEGWY